MFLQVPPVSDYVKNLLNWRKSLATCRIAYHKYMTNGTEIERMSTESRQTVAEIGWVQSREPRWDYADQQAQKIGSSIDLTTEKALEAVHLYSELGRDLAVAQRIAARSQVTRRLSKTYLKLHSVLSRPPRSIWRGLQKLVFKDVPVIAAGLRVQIIWSTAGFLLAAAAGWALVVRFPRLAFLFVSEEMYNSVTRGELWTDGLLNIVPSSVLSFQIFTNNIVVTLSIVCAGAIYGLGTAYIIGLNGAMLGVVLAFTAQYGMAGELLKFVYAHGFVELSVICIAGGVGISIGEALVRPGQMTRTAAFAEAASRAIRLLGVCVVFLIGAGLIEGYISPDPRYSEGVRLLVGISYWIVFMLTIVGFWQWKKSHTTFRHGTKRAVVL